MFSADNCDGLKVHQLKVPGYSAKGETIQLECSYDLEGDELYSIKWYKGYREFFRYVPGDKPSVQIFRVQGVLVDVSTLQTIFTRSQLNSRNLGLSKVISLYSVSFCQYIYVNTSVLNIL